MKIMQNKFIANLKNNKSLSLMIFYTTTATKSARTVTAAIMFLMQIIVSVNTAKIGNHIRPDMETTTAVTAIAAVTWTKTFNNMSTKPTIAQQLPTKAQKTYSSEGMALKTSPIILSLFNMSDVTDTMTQVRSAESSAGQGHCKSLTAAWGDIDPNIFYICNAQTKQPLKLRCPEGKGFFHGMGYTGCVPYEQWPACISSGRHEQVTLCDSEHMQQPWEFMNPNMFYVCLKENTEPTILNCEPGKGFVHAIVVKRANSGGSADGSRDVDVGSGAGAVVREIIGCASWEKWRTLMQCSEYY